MGLNFTGTCDCCGATFDATTGANYVQSNITGKVLCTQHGCAAKAATELITQSFTAFVATHAAAVVGGVVPTHP